MYNKDEPQNYYAKFDTKGHMLCDFTSQKQSRIGKFIEFEGSNWLLGIKWRGEWE